MGSGIPDALWDPLSHNPAPAGTGTDRAATRYGARLYEALAPLLGASRVARDVSAADLLERAGPGLLEVAGCPAQIPSIRGQAVFCQPTLDRQKPQIFLDQLLHDQRSATRDLFLKFVVYVLTSFRPSPHSGREPESRK